MGFTVAMGKWWQGSPLHTCRTGRGPLVLVIGCTRCGLHHRSRRWAQRCGCFRGVMTWKMTLRD